MYIVSVNDNSFLIQAMPPAFTTGGRVFSANRLRGFSRYGYSMQLLRGTTLLFGLNLLDALLTLVWVRNGVAGEGNRLMAELLEIGDLSFLAAKIAIGVIAAFVLIRWSYLKLAHYGLAFALSVYIALMGIHVLTGLSAMGLISSTAIEDFALWSQLVFASVV